MILASFYCQTMLYFFAESLLTDVLPTYQDTSSSNTQKLRVLPSTREGFGTQT